MVSRVSGNTGIFKSYNVPPCTFASTVKLNLVITSIKGPPVLSSHILLVPYINL